MTKEALKLALEAIDVYCPDYMHGLPKKHYIAAIKEALAQPVQPAEEWPGQSNIESPHNACQHRGYCKQLKAQPAPLPVQERNFCERCGKRTADLTTVHTCTPPQEKNNG